MTVTLNPDDKYIIENLKAIQNLRAFGLSDDQIQTLYNEQVKKDKEADNDKVN